MKNSGINPTTCWTIGLTGDNPTSCWTFTFNELPENIKGNMPTVSELENELKKLIE